MPLTVDTILMLYLCNRFYFCIFIHIVSYYYPADFDVFEYSTNKNKNNEIGGTNPSNLNFRIKLSTKVHL